MKFKHAGLQNLITELLTGHDKEFKRKVIHDKSISVFKLLD
jgi:hypothetical protein